MNHSTNDDTNDQTPSDPEPTETSLSLDAITERRLRNHLATSAERVTLCDLESSSVRRTARQRTVRRHRMVVGGVAAATVMGMVVGVQALSGGGGEGIRFTEGDATATDPNPLRVAVAGLDSTEWTVSELPIDTNATSDLPFDLENCRVIIARTQVSNTVQGTTIYNSFPGSYPSPQNVGIQMERVHSLGDFGKLSPSVPVTVEFAAGTVLTAESLDGRTHGNTGEVLIPKVAYDGATSVWIVALISKSPILSIDQQRSDFELLQEQHWYVQEVLPEQIPQEWRDLTEKLLQEQLEAAAAVKTGEP